MNEIEIITKDKTDLELLYEMAQRYCAAEQKEDIYFCDFYRNTGLILAREIAEKQIQKSDPSFIDYLCSLFYVVVLPVSLGKTFAEVKELLSGLGIK